jgi:hypothetical protein
MITAAKARKQSDAVQKTMAPTKIAEIEKMIKEATELGKSYVRIYEELCDSVIETLEEHGYDLDNNFDSDDRSGYYHISW